MEQIQMDSMRAKSSPGFPALKRQDYLDMPVVQAFCSYLTELFQDRAFEHQFEVRWKRWAQHLLNNHQHNGRVIEQSVGTTKAGKPRKITKLRLKSLKSAYESYYWPTNSLVAVSDGTADEDEDECSVVSQFHGVAFDRESNEARLTELRKSLTCALRNSDAGMTFTAAMKILDWGQVYKGSVGWLIQNHESGELVKAIKRAIEILDGDLLSDATSFGKMPALRMDSGMTKVYSLASERSIIYDDRVGAALGLIVTNFLKDNVEHQCNADKDKVPEALKFMRSATPSRNPSLGDFKFPPKKSGALHAQSNLMANWMMCKVAGDLPSLWDKRELFEKLQAMESALFMLGYGVA
jgi:hypothetical protein